MIHPVGSVVYVRMQVVSHDPRSVWGDVLVGTPVGQDGKPDGTGGLYGFKPQHCVQAGQVVKAIREMIAKEKA